MPLASKAKSKVIAKQKVVKLKIKKGDTVVVLSGKDKGKRGQVMEVNPTNRTVMVDGLNLATKHQKKRPSAGGQRLAQQGGRIQEPLPLDISKVMLIDPHSDKPTRVGRKLVEGKLVRVAKTSGELVDAI